MNAVQKMIRATPRLPGLSGLGLLVLSHFCAFSVCQAQAEEPADERPVSLEKLRLEPLEAIKVDFDDNSVPDRIGEWVRVQGVVTVEPGILGQEFFQAVLQDDTGGVFMFSYDLDEPVEPGRRVEVAGKVSQYNGILQLQDVVILEKGEHAELPEPKRVPVGALRSREHFGERVKVHGEIIETDISRHAIITLQGEDRSTIRLFVPEVRVAQLPWSKLQTGSEIAAVGVSSQYDRAWPYDSGWQVVVTRLGTIQLLESPSPAWYGWLKWAAVAAVLLLALIVALLYIANRRRRQREQEMKTLNALSGALGTPGLTDAQLAERACINLCQFGLFDVAAIHAFDDYGRLRLLALSERDAKIEALLDYARARPAEDAEAILSPAQQEEAAKRFARRGLYLVSVQSLSGRNRPIGFISVFSRSRERLSFVQQRTLSSATKLISLGLEHIFEQAQSDAERNDLDILANTDSLTGLHNRRFLEDYLRIQMAIARRRNNSLSFYVLDIDDFKQLNDAYGHEAGDQVLICLANVLQDSTRASDVVVRLGGEEFLIVAADTGPTSAVNFAERIRERVAKTDFGDCGLPPEHRVTVSIGVASFPESGDSAKGVMRACDEALYQAKRAGRNRVVASN